jgi:hypothetical protein
MMEDNQERVELTYAYLLLDYINMRIKLSSSGTGFHNEHMYQSFPLSYLKSGVASAAPVLPLNVQMFI